MEMGGNNGNFDGNIGRNNENIDENINVNGRKFLRKCWEKF